jgi:hypothetical protein
MWLFSNEGFVSIVQHKLFPWRVLVRGRAKEDIENFAERLAKLGENVTVKQNLDADYHWRLECKKKNAAQVMMDMMLDVNYANFKNNIHEQEDYDRDRAYMSVWSSMNNFQWDKENPNHQIGFGAYDKVNSELQASQAPANWLSDGFTYEEKDSVEPHLFEDNLLKSMLENADNEDIQEDDDFLLDDGFSVLSDEDTVDLDEADIWIEKAKLGKTRGLKRFYK